MAGYKTRSSWHFEGIEFGPDGKRIRPADVLVPCKMDGVLEPCREAWCVRNGKCVILEGV